jgi:methyl-accepting chemotaxis protein
LRPGITPADSQTVRFGLSRLLGHASVPTAPPAPETSAQPLLEQAYDDSSAIALEAALQHQAQLAATAQAIAGGNLARDVQVSSEKDTLGVAFGEMLGGLRRLVGQVKDGAADVDTGAKAAGDAIRSADISVLDLRGAIDAIARGAGEQMAQVRSAVGAIAGVSGEVEQVAASAQDLAEASERARVAAERGADAVRSTVQGMREITDSTVQAAGRVRDLDALSQRIGAVVATIDAIAAQTNLLALNAAIEAARAGAHGRGFAVVAGEVRKLAERSQRETQEIGELVRNIQHETRETAHQMMADAEAAQRERERADQAGEALVEIIAAVEAAARQVDAIAVSAHSATNGTHALVDLMQPVRLVAEANADSTRKMATQIETAAKAMTSAREGTAALAGTADRLRKLISHFRLTEARRQSVNIAVTALSDAWTGTRSGRIVDLSATGARIDGLEAPAGSELQLTFTESNGTRGHRRARVMRCAVGENGSWVGISFLDPQIKLARAA